MKSSVLLLLVLLPALMSCGGEMALAPSPVSTADVISINLVPYHDRESGIGGVVPEGWFPALPGFFLSGPPEDRPDTVLIQRLEAGAGLDQVFSTWRGLLGLTEDPEPAGHRQTQDFAWTLYTYEAEDSNLGIRKGSIALAETGAGIVMVLLVTAPEGYSALHDAVFCPAVDALTLAADDASDHERTTGWPVVAALEQVGNHASESVEFSLAACTRLHLYAIGEGTVQGMEDFGTIENAASGQIVWQMYFFETEAAGAYKNRRVDRTLTLPAGDYRLHFQTNGKHSFGDWGDQAPGDQFWGIALYEDRSPGSHWYYNNWDFNTLGTIFEQETGQNIYQAFEARIGDPLGMQDFFPERLSYTYEYWLSQHPYYGFRHLGPGPGPFRSALPPKGSVAGDRVTECQTDRPCCVG